VHPWLKGFWSEAPAGPPGTAGPGLHAGRFNGTLNPGHGQARRRSALGSPAAGTGKPAEGDLLQVFLAGLGAISLDFCGFVGDLLKLKQLNGKGRKRETGRK
jgi:hypothetical protein